MSTSTELGAAKQLGENQFSNISIGVQFQIKREKLTLAGFLAEQIERENPDQENENADEEKEEGEEDEDDGERRLLKQKRSRRKLKGKTPENKVKKPQLQDYYNMTSE